MINRRNMLLAALFAIPAGAVARFNRLVRPGKGIKVDAGQDRYGKPVKLGPNFNYCKVSAADTERDIAVFESVGNAKGGPPLHVHAAQDEIFCIMEGAYLFQVGDEQFEVKAGDTLFAPRGVPHAFTKLGDEPGKMLITYQPAGQMEDFFKKSGAYQQRPTPEEQARLFEEHGMKIVGPRLPVK
jgi:mannose-6-phosphate isomerase-like protein (cupin superfamily)